MSNQEITVKLPDDLVERAQKVGLALDEQDEQIIAMLESQVRRREAVRRLEEIAGQLQSLPADLKPTPDEIDAEIRAYWAEKAHSDSLADHS